MWAKLKEQAEVWLHHVALQKVKSFHSMHHLYCLLRRLCNLEEVCCIPPCDVKYETVFNDGDAAGEGTLNIAPTNMTSLKFWAVKALGR